MIYRFKDFVYEKPYAPYYDEYRGYSFVIDHYSKEDEYQQHVWLKCTDPNGPSVKGYVELYQLEEINHDTKVGYQH
jgi:hypothetical protein